MSVKPAIRILSAISFGVFCRCAPSTSAIMRSRKVSPGLEVIRILIWSDSTLVPPVTARFANYGRALAGDHQFVNCSDAVDHFPVAGDQVAGVAKHGIAGPQ